ncbi:MAG TPA: LysM peptidoglycan-binding domain-containing protein, partial [Pirellulales bacterium]
GSERRTTADGSPLGLPSGLGTLGPSAPMHRIADGDTLGQLAAHYLGSADRWRELYDFNRDVLTNPELLPIGAELRIPTAPFRPAEWGEGPGARAEANAVVAAPAAGSQSAAARPVGQSLDGTVKAPVSSSGPAATAESPPEPKVRLKLQKLPPFPANGPALRMAPRTYIMQRGDTLNSIAERLYGDGAKETILLEANRNLVAGTPDIRPGMVLVIPAYPANGTMP